MIYLFGQKKISLSEKGIEEWYDLSEINQIKKQVSRHTNFKITARPWTFQIDITYLVVSEN